MSPGILRRRKLHRGLDEHQERDRVPRNRSVTKIEGLASDSDRETCLEYRLDIRLSRAVEEIFLCRVDPKRVEERLRRFEARLKLCIHEPLHCATASAHVFTKAIHTSFDLKARRECLFKIALD